MFTDTHSHIHFREFPDREAVLQRAIAGNVTRQILVGCTVADSLDALHFVRKHPDCQLFSTLGVHPDNADEFTEDVRGRFEKLAKNEKKIVALGEIGLDYFRNLKPHSLQQSAFRAQLALALELDLPVIVHIRDAWEDAYKILDDAGNRRVILHCFTGHMEQAQYALGKGYYLSFSGVLTYPKNEYLRAISALAPETQILLETDCPYLAPQTYRGQRNEPAYLVETAKVLAQARGISLEEIAKLTTANAMRVFSLQ